MLDHHALFRIAHRRGNAVQRRVLHQSSRRTDQRTLSAADTARNIHALMKCGRDDRPPRASDEADGGNFLNLLAHAHAFAAKNAFGCIADNASSGQVAQFLPEPFARRALADAVFLRERTQTAVTAFLTVKTIVRMIRKKKLQQSSAGIDDLPRIRKNPHSLRNGIRAGRNQAVALRPLDFHNADPAGAHRRQVRQMTECRNADADARQSGKNRLPLLSIDNPVVDSNFKHVFSLLQPPDGMELADFQACAAARAADLIDAVNAFCRSDNRPVRFVLVSEPAQS